MRTARPVSALALALVLGLPATAAGQLPADMEVSPDGRHLYTAAQDAFAGIYVVDRETGALQGLDPELDGHLPPAGRMAVAPDGRYVYVADRRVMVDGSITYQWGSIHLLSRDAESGALTHERTYYGGRWQGSSDIEQPTEIELSADGRQLYLLDGPPTKVKVFARDPASGALSPVQSAPVDGVGASGYGMDLAPTADGRHVYVSATGGIRTFEREAATGRLTHTGTTAHGAGELVIAPDGSRVYAGGGSYTVWTRDPATGGLTYLALVEPTAYEGRLLSVSPPGSSVFSAAWRPGTVIESAVTDAGAQPVRTYDSGPDPPGRLANSTAMAWTPDGRFAYFAVEQFTNHEYGAYPAVGPRRVMGVRAENDGLTPIGTFEPQPPPATGGPQLEWAPRGSVSIDGGALYTNDPDVEIRVQPGFSSFAFRLSNTAGDFAASPAQRVRGPARTYPWRLETGPAGQTLPDRSVRRVHLRFVQAGPIALPDISDDIVLDMSAPQLLLARIERSRLKLKARDNRSGVKRVQLTANRKRPGKARTYKSSLPVGSKAKRVFVRVLDGAGNHSKWRSARRP
jgi:6-phosphogluconolactonase (cycloisomerase 2 family)